MRSRKKHKGNKKAVTLVYPKKEKAAAITALSSAGYSSDSNNEGSDNEGSDLDHSKQIKKGSRSNNEEAKIKKGSRNVSSSNNEENKIKKVSIATQTDDIISTAQETINFNNDHKIGRASCRE